MWYGMAALSVVDASALRLGSGRVDVGAALSGRRLLCAALSQGVRDLVLLAWAINRDLNGDLATLDFLAVHVGTCLLLQLLARERDEAEATALARLVASLQLANHELGNGTESDLGGGGRVVGEDLEQLGEC